MLPAKDRFDRVPLVAQWRRCGKSGFSYVEAAEGRWPLLAISYRQWVSRIIIYRTGTNVSALPVNAPVV